MSDEVSAKRRRQIESLGREVAAAGGDPVKVVDVVQRHLYDLAMVIAMACTSDREAALLARDVGQELPRCVAVVRKTLAGDPLDTP
jgi:hypothetical protein